MAKEETAILTELEALKKLMILILFEKGFTQRQIAMALGTSQATISRMFPSGALKKGAKKPNAEAS